jgi:hypothetical protein
MRICGNCGAAVADGDSFCGTCGTFLAWESDDPAAPSTVPVAPPDEPATSDDDDTPAAVEAQAAAAGAERSGQPGAVLPGRPVAPRPVVREFDDEVRTAPEDLICPYCATANQRGRRFCRRCGRSLRPDAPVVTKVPWWRRLRWPRGWGRLDTVPRLLAALLVLALLIAVGVAAARYGGRAIDAIRDRTAKPEQIRPATVTASSEAKGHPATSVTDGLSNRFWAPAAGQAEGQYVEMTFKPPIRLLKLIVHTGASPQPEAFGQQARPASLELTAWDAAGTRTTKLLSLADRPGEQRFDAVIGSVTRLRFTIGSGYGTGPGRQVALAEIELFKRP